MSIAVSPYPFEIQKLTREVRSIMYSLCAHIVIHSNKKNDPYPYARIIKKDTYPSTLKHSQTIKYANENSKNNSSKDNVGYKASHLYKKLTSIKSCIHKI